MGKFRITLHLTMSEEDRIKNLKALVNFCHKETAKEDAPNFSTPQDPERKEFLEGVLNNIRNSRPHEEIKQYLDTIEGIVVSENSSDDNIQATEDGLQYILDYTCDTPDNGSVMVESGMAD